MTTAAATLKSQLAASAHAGQATRTAAVAPILLLWEVQPAILSAAAAPP